MSEGMSKTRTLGELVASSRALAMLWRSSGYSKRIRRKDPKLAVALDLLAAKWDEWDLHR